MGVTSIEWCDYTFNPWWGCTKVSAGCKNCYAEDLDKRYSNGAHWGVGKPRRTMSDAYWREPYKWDHLAGNLGVRRRVFCASMADVFDDEAPKHQLERLFDVITETPHLDWLLLTKRPERMRAFFTGAAREGDLWPNVWCGTSVEDQEQADVRIPELLATPATVRFLSCEPLLGPVDLTDYIAYGAGQNFTSDHQDRWSEMRYPITWVIVGGESGPRARPMDLAWARSLIAQCRAVEDEPHHPIAVFVKQLGAFPVDPSGVKWPLELRDRKGGEMAEWPPDLRVREFPR